MTEQRKMRVMINKAGGTAGPENVNYRVSLPSKWMKALRVSLDNRGVVLEFDGEKIVIRKEDTQN